MNLQKFDRGVRCSLPTFSESIEAKLPAVLQQMTNLFSSSDDKDAILLSAITTLSGTLHNVRTSYGGDDVYPSLFACVVGSSGSNKGIIKFTRHLVQPIHKAWLENGTRLLIPENCSSAGFIKLIEDNDGVGIFSGTEIDTLLKTWKSGWGNFSSDLRKAFHHEPITLYRKTDDEYVEIENPRMSLLTSGTPDQFANLFAGNTENGLYSRFLTMFKPSSDEWKDQFQSEKQQLKQSFVEFGRQYYHYWKELEKSEHIDVCFTPEQQASLNEYFANQYRNYGLTIGEESHAFVERAAIKVIKIALTLTALRQMEEAQNPLPFREEMEVSSCDFASSMQIVKTLMEHFTALYEIIPQNEAVSLPEFKTEEMKQFYEALPNEFTSNQFVAIAANQGVPLATAKRHICRFVTQSLLDHIKHGEYKKIC